MSSYRVTERDLREGFAAARKHLDDLEQDLERLMERARQNDGYPAGGEGRSSGVSDPTLRAVLIRSKNVTPAMRAIARLWSAMKTLDSADSDRRLALPPGTPKPNKGDPDLWCRNCAPYGHNEPKSGKTHYCRFCGDYRRDNGNLPPLSVLERHWSGRVFNTDVERGQREVEQWARALNLSAKDVMELKPEERERRVARAQAAAGAAALA